MKKLKRNKKENILGKTHFTAYEKETRHPFEQKPIKDDFKVEVINKESVEQVKPISIKNNDKYKADIIDSDNKENIPPQIKKKQNTYIHLQC